MSEAPPADLKDDAPLELTGDLAATTGAAVPPLPKLSDLLAKYRDDLDIMMKRIESEPEFVAALKHEDIELSCLRYLIGHGTLDKAWSKFLLNIKWRQEYKSYDFSDEKLKTRDFTNSEKISKYIGAATNACRTKDGRFFSLIMLGRMKVEELEKNVTVDEYKACMAEQFVLDVRYFNRASRENDVLMSVFHVVDIKGVGTSHSKYIPYFQIETQFLELLAPECAGVVVINNAPGWFNWIWSIISPMLDPATISKTRVYGQDGKGDDFIRSFLKIEDLPVMYGGKNFTKADEWMENNVPKYTSLSVSAGSKDEVTFPVVDIGSQLVWHVKPASYDVNITVKFIAESKKETIIAEATKSSAGLNGILDIETPGRVVVIFDNSYSYFTSKTCLFSFRVKTSK